MCETQRGERKREGVEDIVGMRAKACVRVCVGCVCVYYIERRCGKLPNFPWGSVPLLCSCSMYLCTIFGVVGVNKLNTLVLLFLDTFKDTQAATLCLDITLS